MVLLTFSRLIKFSLQNFFRNIWLSVVTITIVVLTLFSVTSLVLVNAVLEEAIQIVKEKVDVSVYFKPTASEEQVRIVKASLESINYVKDVRYVSKSDALNQLREQYQDRPLILESLKELDENPLGDTLIVSTHQTSDYQKVIDYLNASPQFAPLIESKNFEDNQFVIDRLQHLSTQVTNVGWGIALFFAIIAVLVIVNTIRIAIYSHRDEVAIMKLVGASNWFVRGPFIGEAIMYAVLGTILTIVLTLVLTNIFDPYVRSLLGRTDFSMFGYLSGNAFKVFGAELVGMTLVSVISTSIALSRYLKV